MAAERKKYPSLYTDGADPLASIKLLVPLSSFVGISFLVAAVLPRWLSALVGLACAGPHLLRAYLRSTRRARLPELEHAVHGRMAGRINGDFCVFLIGIRNQHPLALDGTFRVAVGAFNGMIRELEAAAPEKSGFLGASPYVGTNWNRGSHTMAVMYWRSHEHLQAFARDRDASHWPAWKLAQKLCRESPHIALWHEAYNVRGGDYDAIYVNCPPLGLGHAGYLLPAKGKLATSEGRMGHSDGQDWPKEADVWDPDSKKSQ